MGSQNVRRGVVRAGWNKQHTSWYSTHYVVLSAVMGLIFSSWWVFLVALFLIGLFEATRVGRMVTFSVYALPWIVVAALLGMAIGGTPAACVFAFLGGGVVYVMLDSGWTFFQDL